MGDDFPSIREAIRARERHSPMFQLFKLIEEHGEIPQTFEGELPSEVFVANPLPRLKIGQFYAVSGPDGKEMKGKLTHATVIDDKAHCFLYDPDTNQSFTGTFQLSLDEVVDYAKYPDTFFGVYQKQTRRVETAVEMFDFFFDAYRQTPKERLLESMAGHPDHEMLKTLSQKALAEILSERYVMNAVAQGFAVKPPRNVRRSSRGKVRLSV